MADRVGQQLGNYRLVRKLGEGGFAEVYQAENIHIGTQAAIKLLFTRMGKDEIEDFKKEARTLANLIHPHIVRVLDFGVDNSIPYLMMDYAPGGTLRTRHPKGSRLPLPTVVEYVKQVASALQYAHDQKIVHRDIKPENMLIGRSGEILLSDFGIALIAQSSRYQSTKDMAGTIAYMAPEQIAAHPRPASDQYSLAIVAYEWLCGTRPFHGSFTEIAIKHSVTPPPPLRSNLPTLPLGVEQVIMTALTKKPDERFKSVKAFATALEHASLSTFVQPSQPAVVPQSSQPPTIRASQTKNTLASEPVQLPPTNPTPLTPVQIAPQNRLQIEPTSPAYNESKTSSSPDIKQAAMLDRAKSPSGKKISRRTMIIGGSAIALVGVGGSGAAWLIHAFSIPQGTLYFTYRGHTNSITSATWSPDGMRIASASYDTTVQVWNTSDGSHILTYTGHTGEVKSVVWSPNSKRIASASNDKTVQVWNASDGSGLFTYQGHTSFVTSVVWSPDGKRIASASGDGTVQVWNASDGSQPLTYNGNIVGVDSVAWSPDGKHIVSGSNDSKVQVWNASNGSGLFTYQGHRDSVDSVAWSPDDKHIASASWDSTVQVWNASDGSGLFTYQGHTSFVTSVAWSPDGKRIASASYDGTVQVWNASNGTQLYIYHGHREWVTSVAWSPDGQRIASASADNTVQVWQAV